MEGLFADDPPFVCQQRPRTSEDTARAISEILWYQLNDIGFKNEIYLGTMNAILFGTGIWKWGWETYARKTRRYVQKEPAYVQKSAVPGAKDIVLHNADLEIEIEETDEVVDRPTFECVRSARHILPDPKLNVPDISKAGYVVERRYPNYYDLEKLRDRPGFNLPSKEELLELFLPPKEETVVAVEETEMRNPQWDARSEARYNDTSADPFTTPLELLEHWTPERYMVVLNRKLVICNDENPYGCIPYLSVGWWDIPEAFWSLGITKTVGSFQRLQQGVWNAWLDNVALNLNGVYIRALGKGVQSQSIRLSPGKIVNVGDDIKSFQPLQRLNAVPEAMEALQLASSQGEVISGATEASTQGIAGSSGHSNLARTATGANLLAGGTGSRIQTFVDKLADNVLIPLLYHFTELNAQLLPPSTFQEILDEQLTEAYKGSVVDILNARVKFTVLAGTKMAGKRNMAQSLPILVQYITNQPTITALAQEGKKVNFDELIQMWFEVSGWRDKSDVIIPMTAQDKQQYAQSQPGALMQQKGQQQQQMVAQKHNNDLDLVDAENMAKAAREVLRTGIEKASEPETVQGAPGGTAFGTNE
jgi:hypothetical protein